MLQNFSTLRLSSHSFLIIFHLVIFHFSKKWMDGLSKDALLIFLSF